MNLEEIVKEIVEIIEARKKCKKEKAWWPYEKKHSKARLRRLRITLNEIIKKEEDEFYEF